ncbi:RNA polymerase sigma factor [Hoeflea marina]|uniref:RNA polymerase sigma factor n=1 Tax=Hoeflea marina TaxID=274592 RepID=UPI001AECF7E4|nr:RNA polymerase sigma factor [Hoeflea marina]
MTGARQAIEALARADTGRLLGSLLNHIRDFQMAEDCLQEALESALVHWQRSGLPASPAGWVLQTARRKAIDRLRRARNFERKAAEYAVLLDLDRESVECDEPAAIPDERLRLIFTCCHPALDAKTSVALTLRTLCGLTTREIARAFLDSEDAMAQRLVRARHKITRAGIPFEIPGPDLWSERLNAVLTVIYLVFNEGYSATAGPTHLRTDLCEEALRLGSLMKVLRPAEAEIEGLLALMLLIHARASARSDPYGAMVPLDRQDRTLWDRAMIARGLAELDRALSRHSPGPFQLQAAIGAVHAEAPDHAATGWRDIALLYDGLHAMTGNPVHLLNRAVAVSFAEGPEAALSILDRLEADLGQYQPFHAARADLLRRMRRFDSARAAYRRAISLSGNGSERDFLSGRLEAIAEDD